MIKERIRELIRVKPGQIVSVMRSICEYLETYNEGRSLS